jgi:hypothetical protein
MNSDASEFISFPFEEFIKTLFSRNKKNKAARITTREQQQQQQYQHEDDDESESVYFESDCDRCMYKNGSSFAVMTEHGPSSNLFDKEDDELIMATYSIVTIESSTTSTTTTSSNNMTLINTDACPPEP